MLSFAADLSAPSFFSSLKRYTRGAASLAIALLVLGAVVHAQTAHFGSQGTLTSNVQNPNALAIDTNNNVYIADQNHNRILKETRQSNGTYVESVLLQGLSSPEAIALDANGNLYLAETGAQRVTKQTPSGGTYIATTIATGSYFGGVAVDASGNVFAVDTVGGRILQASPNGSTYTVATVASGLGQPEQAVFSNGTLYFAEHSNNRISKLVSNGGGSYAVTPVFTVTGPEGVGADSANNLYVTAGTTLGKWFAGTNYQTHTVLYTSSNNPVDAKVDSLGNIFIANFQGNVDEVLYNSALRLGSVQVGQSASGIATLTFDSGGKLGGVAVSTTGSTANSDFGLSGTTACNTSTNYTAGALCVVGVTFSPQVAGLRQGSAVVTDTAGNVIATLNVQGVGNAPETNFFSDPAASAVGGGYLTPSGVTVDNAGTAYITDLNASSNLKIVPAGCASASCVTSRMLGADSSQVAVDGAGNLYLAQRTGGGVRKVPAGCTSNACTSILAAGLGSTQDVALDGTGTVYFANRASPTVYAIPSDCAQNSCIVTLGGGFQDPFSIAADTSGVVYVADFTQNQVYRIPLGCQAASCVTTVGGGFVKPVKLAVDPSGAVLVADYGAGSIKRVPAGCTSAACVTVLSTKFAQPVGLAIDRLGNLLVVDAQTNTVGRIDLRDPPTINFASTAVGTLSADSPKPFTLANIGNAALTLNAFSYSEGFSSSAITGCASGGQTLAAGATCTERVQYRPQRISNTTGTASSTDNDLRVSKTQSVQFTGTATPGTATVLVPNLTATRGDVITLTATVSGGGTAPAGTVTIAVGNGAPQTATCTAGTGNTAGTEACSVANYTATASGTITAQFSNDANYNSTSGTGTLTVTQTPSIANSTLTLDNAVTDAGGAATLTAAVRDVNGILIPNVRIEIVYRLISTQGGSVVVGTTYTNGPGNRFGGGYASAGQLYSTGEGVSPDGQEQDTLSASLPSVFTVSGTFTVNGTTYNFSPVPPSITFVQPTFQVTKLVDDATGNAANCPDLGTTPGGTSTTCSLRDAIAATNARNTVSAITFAPALTASATTANPAAIVLSGTQLTVSGSVNITGPGANLLQISGNGVSRVFEMDNANGGTTATVQGLTVTNGLQPASGGFGGSGGCVRNNGATVVLVETSVTHCTAQSGNLSGSVGGGIEQDSGSLSILRSTISGNSGSLGAGIAINAGPLTVTDSTFTGNQAPADSSIKVGGGIEVNGGNNSVFTMTGSTVTGNSAGANGFGGGISAGNQATINNSIVAGNTALQGADISGTYAGSGNVVGGDPLLSPLAYNGGTTQTMLPLPGSPAFCAGLVSADGGLPQQSFTDQRGVTHAAGYCTNAQLDAGAVQTAYALAFTTQPSDVRAGNAVAPAPAAVLSENGTAFTAAAETVTLTQSGTGVVTGNTASTSTADGSVSFPALRFDTPQTADRLTAAVVLNGSVPVSVTSLASNSFNVTSAVYALQFVAVPPSLVTAGGNAGTVTVKEVDNTGATVYGTGDPVTLTVVDPRNTSTTYNGNINSSGLAVFDLSGVPLTIAGSYQYVASQPGAITQVALETVTAAAGSQVTVVSGSGQSATIASPFPAPLVVNVTDAYGNNVHAGTTVTFTGPATGASATLSSSTAVTGSNSRAQVNATANGQAGSYGILAAVSGGTVTATFSLTNTPGTATIAVSPATVAYGAASVTLSAQISYAGATPTGAVSFQVDGAATSAPTCSGTASPRTCTVNYNPSALTVGSHTIQVNEVADGNYGPASNTNTLTVTKAASTLTAPASVTATYGTATSFNVQVSGGGATAPSGSISYTIGAGATQTAAVNAGTAAISIPSNQPASSTPYTITINYPGDGNYTAAAQATTQLTVNKATAQVTLGSLSATYDGNPHAATATTTPAGLNVTITYNGAATAPTAPGSYAVVATANDTNYTGSATGTLVISAATSSITFAIPNHGYGDAPFAVSANSQSTGAFTYTVISGPAAISGNTVAITGAGSVTVQASQAADANYAASSKLATFAIAQAPLSVTANAATRAYGAVNPAFTGTIAGQQYGDVITETFTTSAAVASGPGAYTITPSATGAKLANYTVSATNGTLTIVQASTTTTLTASATSVTPGQPVTLRAVVASSTTGTPTGTVTFFDNGAALTSATLSNGVATSSSATLSPGTTHTITAVYAGDTNFLPSNTAAGVGISTGVLDFTFTTSGPQAYTVVPGATATYTFGIAPTFGSYAGPVTFSITGLPTGATATFTPTTLTAGSSAQTVTLSVVTPRASAKLYTRPSQSNRVPLLALTLLPFLASRRVRRCLKGHALMMVLLAVGVATAAGLTGCGTGNNGFLLQQPNTYTLTVTASAGSVQHSQTVTLIVQ